MPLPLWSPDGAALLWGALLLDPVARVAAPLDLPDGARVAIGPQGRVAALRPAEGPGLAAQVQVLTAGGPGPAWDLPPELPADAVAALLWVGEEVYVHGSPDDAGALRCALVGPAGPRKPEACLEGGFVAVDALRSAPGELVVIYSHGEGHPGVDLVRWTGGPSAPVDLPWHDLYPFGPMELMPRLDGSFDIRTPCALGPPRPCEGPKGEGPSGPLRAYRWRPGEAPALRAMGRRAADTPSPAGDAAARMRGDRLCVDLGSGRPWCVRPSP